MSVTFSNIYVGEEMYFENKNAWEENASQPIYV